MYRRQWGECMKYDLINTSFGYVFLNCMEFLFWFFMNKALLVEIHILCAQKWAGGHTVPSRYGCVHEHLQLYKRNNYIHVNVIIYVYIRTHRWLYVVITTKVRYFLVRYFINTALLVEIHIPYTQKCTAGYYSPNPCFLIWQNQKHDGRTYTKTSDDILTNRKNES